MRGLDELSNEQRMLEPHDYINDSPIILCERGNLAKNNKMIKQKAHLDARPRAGLREVAKRMG